jgi:predicted nucleic acid-binding Zn ribbon protein
MPTYTAKCSVCSTHHDYVRRVADRDDTPLCCETKTDKQLSTPQISAMAFGGHKGFVTDATGTPRWIENGSDLKRYMRENNLTVPEEGVERAKDARRNQEIASDKALDQAVSDALSKHSI